MVQELIDIKDDYILLRTSVPSEVGTPMKFKVQLPSGAVLNSFDLMGTVTKCSPIVSPEDTYFQTRMEIGELSQEKQLILQAYIDFLRGEKVLAKLETSKNKFIDEIQKLSTHVDTLVGYSEMILRDVEKTTIH